MGLFKNAEKQETILVALVFLIQNINDGISGVMYWNLISRSQSL